MERERCSEREALRIIIALSQGANRKLLDIATEIAAASRNENPLPLSSVTRTVRSTRSSAEDLETSIPSVIKSLMEGRTVDR
jgi:hypothetical protein